MTVDEPAENTPPSIGGVPASEVPTGGTYRFLPDASDDDADSLQFSVIQLPTWATFDSATGEISGSPVVGDVGVFDNIVVRVSDGSETVELPAFSVTVVRANQSPSLSGTAVTRVLPGDAYQFTPEFSDADGDPLIFSVMNLPAWASFDATTGEIVGGSVPEGLYEDIVISVSDGQHSQSLAPFFVRSAPLMNLAAAYGVASQGSSYSSAYPASLVIDGDTTNFNHTACSDGSDWWQVQLPPTTRISRVEIMGRNSNTWRLEGATVTLSEHSRENGNVSDIPLATLAGSADVQGFDIVEPSTARYVIVEVADGKCLHLSEVRVFGDTDQAPVFDKSSIAVNIPLSTRVGDVLATLEVADYQGDAMTLRISVDSVPFAIDAEARLTLRRPIDHNHEQAWNFEVEASDGVNVSSTTVQAQLGGGHGVLVERWDEPANSYPVGPTTTIVHTVAPDSTFFTERFQLGNAGSNYRQLLTAVLVPESTGERVFSLAADDTATLWLTPDGVGSIPEKLVTQSTSTIQGDWAGSAVSEPVMLEAGQGYELTVLHEEFSGSDHVTLGWKTLADAQFTVVPEEVLYVDALSVGIVEPSVHALNSSTLLSGTSDIGTVVTQLSVSDPQGDAVTLSLDADVPFTVQPDGTVVVAGPLATGARYTFDVSVTDGTHRSSETLTIDTTADTALTEALENGDASAITTGELVDAMKATAVGIQTSREQLYRAVFGMDGTGAIVENMDVSLGSLDWTLNHDAVFYESIAPGGNHPLLVSNTTYKSDTASSLEVPVAMAGVADNGARHAALGANLLAGVGAPDASMQAFTRRLLAWLLETDMTSLDDATLNIVVAHQTNSYWFKHDAATHAWFDTHYPDFTVNSVDVCDNAALANCLDSADILVIGQDEPDVNGGFDLESTMSAVLAARARGVPMLYLQSDGGLTDLGKSLMAELGLETTDNYWFKEQLAGFDPATLLSRESGADALISAVANIHGGLIDVVYDDESCTAYVGTVTCLPESIENSWGGTLQSSVFDGIEYLQGSFAALDEQHANVFDLGTGYRLLKLAALLGDHYRDDSTYPMDKVSTDAATFYRALLGDYAVNYARNNNPMQPDVGSFTDAQSELNSASVITRTLTLVPEFESGWTSTGLYVPPGRAMTLHRTDASPTELWVKVNFLRHSTRVWNTDGYTRPRFVTSREIELEAGESVVLSTPYGGPLYVWVDGVEGLPEPLSLEVAGVSENPLLDGDGITDISTFVTDTETTDSDWVDLRTPQVEIHSLKSHMLSSFSDQDGDRSDGYQLNDVQDYIDDLNTYLIAGNYALAGYTGEGLPELSAQVRAWCTARGFDSFQYEGEARNLCTDTVLHPKRRKQHINSDVIAYCGSLCAGNPFDSGYAIGPLGWGENHEMGHNLQRHRIKIYGSRSNEVSNNLFPIHTLWRWTINQGLDQHPAGRGGSHAEAFAQLQAAIAAGTPADENHPTWAGTGTYDNNGPRLAFYEQLVWTHGSWSVYTKMYLLERLFTDAIRSDSRWNALGAAMGFDTYTRETAVGMEGNDFMYIAASLIEGRDYQDFFAAWGIVLSDAAIAQVASYGLSERVPAAMYYSDVPVMAQLPGAADLVPLDGTSAWVDPAP